MRSNLVKSQEEESRSVDQFMWTPGETMIDLLTFYLIPPYFHLPATDDNFVILISKKYLLCNPIRVMMDEARLSICLSEILFVKVNKSWRDFLQD